MNKSQIEKKLKLREIRTVKTPYKEVVISDCLNLKGVIFNFYLNKCEIRFTSVRHKTPQIHSFYRQLSKIIAEAILYKKSLPYHKNKRLVIKIPYDASIRSVSEHNADAICLRQEKAI